MNILNALWPILLALVAGIGFGRLAPAAVNRRLIRLITPLIWLLLFLIGHEFGEILVSARAISQILQHATVIAVSVTGISGVLIWGAILLLRRQRGLRDLQASAQPEAATRPESTARSEASPLSESASRPEASSLPEAPALPGRLTLRERLQQAWPPIREALVALGMVLAGALVFLAERQLGLELPLPPSGTFLLLLIGMVGIDLAQIRISRQWLSVSMLAVPALVMVGSILGGVLAAWLTGEPLQRVLVLSTGFGWFSLSSVLVGDTLGQTWGTMALTVDLVRELLGITLMYMIGQHWPQIAIGAGGATTMDTTLPIVRQTCPPAALPLALASGFFLTLAAPILMSLFLAK